MCFGADPSVACGESHLGFPPLAHCRIPLTSLPRTQHQSLMRNTDITLIASVSKYNRHLIRRMCSMHSVATGEDTAAVENRYPPSTAPDGDGRRDPERTYRAEPHQNKHKPRTASERSASLRGLHVATHLSHSARRGRLRCMDPSKQRCCNERFF